MWPLSLRAAVTGTKLEELAKLGVLYEEIKREILHAFGRSAEELWKELLSRKQGNESFRQICLRIERQLECFRRLAVIDEEQCDFSQALVKYVTLESCLDDMRTYLIEHKVSNLTLVQFQDLGVSHQAAHGRQKKGCLSDGHEKSLRKTEKVSTAHVCKVSVEESVAKLESVPIMKRRAWTMENRLCFNCCREGHRSTACHFKKRCGQCGEKHHTLLHYEVLTSHKRNSL